MSAAARGTWGRPLSALRPRAIPPTLDTTITFYSAQRSHGVYNCIGLEWKHTPIKTTTKHNQKLFTKITENQPRRETIVSSLFWAVTCCFR